MKTRLFAAAALLAAFSSSASSGSFEALRSSVSARTGAPAAPRAAAPARAGRVTLPAYMTCSRRDADFWYEAGIVGGPGGAVKALLVAHNEDTGAARLKLDAPVSVNQHGETTVYEDDGGRLTLAVKAGPGGRLSGRLTLRRADGSSSEETGLVCRENGSVSFDNP